MDGGIRINHFFIPTCTTLYSNISKVKRFIRIKSCKPCTFKRTRFVSFLRKLPQNCHKIFTEFSTCFESDFSACGFFTPTHS